MNGNKTALDVAPHGCFSEPTDDDSVNSLEVGARAVSSTIDLKVDVHRKNSSESSEELSLKPVIEDEANAANETEESGLLHERRITTPELRRSPFRSKKPQKHRGKKLMLKNEEKITSIDDGDFKLLQNFRSKPMQLNSNKLWLKNEEGITSIDDGDFALSQSDCHIAKLRKDSIEDLSEEYKMSQSDCHISKSRQEGEEKHEKGEMDADLSPGMQMLSKDKELIKKRHQNGFSRNLSCESQGDKNSLGIDKNGSFDIGNLAANGSCGVLTLNQSDKEQIKNTGSLELPLKDTDATSSLEKGNSTEL